MNHVKELSFKRSYYSGFKLILTNSILLPLVWEKITILVYLKLLPTELLSTSGKAKELPELCENPYH
ncbi:MAG: hypothetical protein ACEPOV_12345 [Hyphomicrobiales bacterium]